MAKRENLIKILAISAFFFLWELVAYYGYIKYLPRLSEVGLKLYIKMYDKRPEGATLPEHIIASCQIFGVGTFMGFIVGFFLGSIIGWTKPVLYLFRIPFEVIRNISPIAYIPIAIVWFGIGTSARTFLIFIITFIMSFYTMMDGMKIVPRPLVDVAKVFGAGHWKVFRYIALPVSRPYIIAALRQAIVSGWQTLVAAELLAAQIGLGNMIIMGRYFVDFSLMVLGMIIIGAIGYGINYITVVMEKRLLRGMKV